MSELKMTPKEKAYEIAFAWEKAVNRSDFKPKVWTKPNGSEARIYTVRGEYVTVDQDLNITTSKPRLTWGHEFPGGYL